MDVFNNYAQYYDILYQEKDYEGECDFLKQIFEVFSDNPILSILELGCGTGGHALPLARRGYDVTGVDCSEQMIAIAKTKATQANLSVEFQQGDIRNLELEQTFDAVISMFAVMSYQTTNDDLTTAFRTARHHLEPGGVFVFDAWFGPAVLTQRPSDRYKTIEVDGERIIRFASPVLDILQHTVQVNYKILRLRDDRVVDEVDESHLMRFLFPQEIAYYLAEAGFKLLKLCPFMELNRQPTEQDWNVTVVAERV